MLLKLAITEPLLTFDPLVSECPLVKILILSNDYGLEV